MALVFVTTAIAVIASPIASGASDKTFWLAVSSPVCNGGSITVTVTNSAKTQTLGSIEVYFPNNSVASTSRGVEITDATRDVIRIDNLNLPKNTSMSFTVTLESGTFTNAQLTAVGKQSNTFNDTQGGANLFENDPDHPFPTFSTVTCGTVQGRVFHDRNADGLFTTGTGAFNNADVPKAWTVKVFGKDAGAPTYPATVFATTTSSAATGEYSVSLPFGRDYKLCVEAAGSDASSAWGLQDPTENALCGKISNTSEASSAGHELLNLSANQSGKDFEVVPITGILFGAGDTSTVGGYTVTAGTNSTKPDARYAQETWVDSNGGTNFRFAPITQCAPPLDCTQKLYLLETLNADVNRPSDGQIELRYDDVAPFNDGELDAMPYCLIDPRQSGGALAATGVLPTGDTSCIVTGSQEVIAGGKVRVVYRVYTALDGGRRIG